MAIQTRDWFLTALHIVALGFALAMTIATMSMVVMADEKRTPFHITNTFLSVFDTDSPINTYIPVSTLPTAAQVQETYYSCLRQAEVGVDDMYNCKADSLPVYQTCINGLVNLPFRVKRMVESIKKILGEYQGDSIEIAQLPSMLTSANTLSTLTDSLTSNSIRFALKQDLAAQSTEVATRLFEAIKTAEDMNGIPSCLGATINQTLTEYSASYDLSTAFDGLWKCTSDVILVEPIQKRAFQKCIPLSAWPTKDVMQTPYTDTLLGSYNKYFVLWIALWLLSSFLVYTCPGFASAATRNGKPQHELARAGKVLVTFGFVWNIAAIVIVLIRTFTSADSFKNAPMSIQTALISLFFTISATVYIGREVYELFFLSDRPPEFKFKGTATKASAAFNSRRALGVRVYQGIGAFMDPSARYDELPDEEYAPLVAPVWNDAWFFVDALFFLTIVGMSYDTVTVDIVKCVFCILAATLCNSALVRLVYEGYVNDKNKVGPSNASGVNEANFPIRVMAVISAVAGLFFAIVIMILVALRFKAEFVTWYVALTSLAPQVIWIVIVVLMEYGHIKTQERFFWVSSVFFALNCIIRLSFLTWVLANFNRDYSMTTGDNDSLYSLLSYINTDVSPTPDYT